MNDRFGKREAETIGAERRNRLKDAIAATSSVNEALKKARQIEELLKPATSSMSPIADETREAMSHVGAIIRHLATAKFRLEEPK